MYQVCYSCVQGNSCITNLLKYFRTGIHLSLPEKFRRLHGANTDDAIRLMKNYQYSDGHEGYHLSEQDASDLANRFQVGESIITFNADRIRQLSASLFALHEEFRVTVLKRPNVALAEPILNSKQMSILLEFYLQIDGKLLEIYTLF